MSVSYKRTIIQVPLEDIKSFEDYANNYGLSFSSAIVMLAKKSIEYEELLKLVPDMITMIKTEQLENEQLNQKKSKKIKTAKTSKKKR